MVSAALVQGFGKLVLDDLDRRSRRYNRLGAYRASSPSPASPTGLVAHSRLIDVHRFLPLLGQDAA
jgi:hypothetical protein